MKFNKIKYEKVDYEEYQNKLNGIGQKIKDAQSAKEVFDAYDEYYQIEAKYGENSTIALIRAYLNSTDEYYNNELVDVFSKDAMLDRNVVYGALLESKFRNEIEDKYGARLLRVIEKKASLKLAASKERSKLSELENKYQKLKATIKFEYKGKILSEGEINKLRKSNDREERKEATYIYYKTFADKRNDFMPLLKEIVKLRNKIAKANGYDTYLEYMNVEKGRYMYGEKELTNFCQLVKEKVVPIARKLHERIKNDLGYDTYKICDRGIFSKEGELYTSGDAQDILARGANMYKDISEDMYNLYNSMVEDKFIDAEESPNKISGIGFATDLLKSKKVFIFANFNGTASADIGVITHEFGHAYQMDRTMKNTEVYDYLEMPNDLVEIPSKTMEQFAYEYAEVFFEGKGEQYIREHKIGIVHEILSYCKTHEFETFLYTHEAATEEEIIAKYLEIEKEYMGEYDISDVKEYLYNGASVYTNMGVYMYPRYLISYALSDMAALFIKNIYDNDSEKGLKLYDRLCELGGTLEYDEAMNYLQIPLPYTREAVEVASEALKKLI